MSGRLAGKAAVITGGASGMGRAAALRFAQEGAAVAIADLDAERGERVAGAIGADGGQALFVKTDVSREEDCDRLIEAAVREFGHVDVLLAAAGISHAAYVSREDGSGATMLTPERGSLLTKPLADWEKVLRVNLTGMLLADRAVARRMVAEGGGGAIINIASGGGVVPIKGLGDYCVSKAGVLMLTKVLALELAPSRIRVNAIGPGMVRTPMNMAVQSDERLLERRVRRIPLGRIGEPEDISNAALFLASDESSYVTGEVLFVDGGAFTG